MLKDAMQKAGGGMDINEMKKMPLGAVVDILAQNGIRMVYMPERHMDSLQVTWNAFKLPADIAFPLTREKKLLLDSDKS